MSVAPASWMPKSASKSCLLCKQSFSIFSWRHHCRHCGVLCCDNCSDHKVFYVPGYPTSIPTKKPASTTTGSSSSSNPSQSAPPSGVLLSSSSHEDFSNSSSGTNSQSSAKPPPEAVPERVCDSCFWKEYAHLLVYNLMITGWQVKTLSGSVEEARQQYAVIPSYASRVLMKVGTGEVLESFFARASWEARVMEKARWTIREKLSRYVIRTWLGETTAPPGAVATTTAEGLSNNPSTLGSNHNNSSYPSLQQQQPMPMPMALSPSAVPPSAVATAPPPFLAEDRSIQLQFGVMVLFRQDQADAVDHFFLNFPYATPEEVVAEGGRFLSAVPRLLYGGVLELTHGNGSNSNSSGGSIPNPVLRLHHLMQAPSHQSSPQAWLKTFQQYFEQLSTVLVIQESQTEPPTIEFGKFQQHYTSCRLKEREWQQQQQQGGRSTATAALVLLDVMGNMVLFCTPSHDVKERLGVLAGDAIMARQSLSAIIAVHPAVSVTAASATRRAMTAESDTLLVYSNGQVPNSPSPSTAQSTRPLGSVSLQSSVLAATALYDLYSARTFLWATAGSALFAVATMSNVAVLLQHHIYLTKTEALTQRGPTATQKLQSLVRRDRAVDSTIDHHHPTAADGPVSNAPPSTASFPVSQSPSAVATTSTLADVVAPPAAVPSTSVALSPSLPPTSTRIIPECGICFLPFNGEVQRPCLCALCGNSMCLQCIRSVDSCPFCRRVIPKTADGGYITNVLLMQMIAGED